MGPFMFAKFLKGTQSFVGNMGEWSGKGGEMMWKESSINRFVTSEIHIHIHIESLLSPYFRKKCVV